jgi:peroxiredoxin
LTSSRLPCGAAFIENAEALRAKGVDAIACVSVNDPFVMRAWGKEAGVGDKVLLLADGSGAFTKAIGTELDLTEKGALSVVVELRMLLQL